MGETKPEVGVLERLQGNIRLPLSNADNAKESVTPFGRIKSGCSGFLVNDCAVQRRRRKTIGNLLKRRSLVKIKTVNLRIKLKTLAALLFKT